jgi:Tfp pilus assembly protein PilO
MTDAKLLRFAAVVVVLAAYVFIFRTGESRIAERLDDNARIVERLHAGERTLASRGRLETERSRLRNRLRMVELDAGRSALVARFLRDAARTAAAHHATIPTIAAAGPQTTGGVAPPLPAVNEQNEPLEEVPLDVTVEGRYADVLATMRALSTSHVLAAVDVASLARKHADGADATLTAALHVVLQRRAPAPTATVPNAAAGNADVRAARG